MTRYINLNPIEATAYWWIEAIKRKLFEIKYSIDEDEKEFYNSFDDFTDIEWRRLYLELNKYISDKVNSLSCDKEIEFYHQDTAINHHNDINEVISIILNKNIPDISLNLSGIESSSIYTNKYGADRIYDISGIVKLDTIYDSNYILSGDFNELEMKNMIMFLIDSGMYDNSFETLKEIFFKLYCSLYTNADNRFVENEFIRIFNQLDDEGFINLGIDNDLSYKSKLKK